MRAHGLQPQAQPTALETSASSHQDALAAVTGEKAHRIKSSGQSFQHFQGGKAAGFAFVLGEKRMLPEFEANATGLKAGETKSFELKFPEDYHGKDVAGKTATFTLESRN